MPFDRGSVTFTVFSLPERLPENYVELFYGRRAGKLDDISEDVQIGWVTGRHLLESNIVEETTICGGHVYLNMRKAERKIPASLLNAICKREELVWMAANEAPKVPAKVKKDIREEMVEKHLMKMPPHITGLPFVIDMAAKMLYLGSGSQTQIDDFVAFFNQTVGIEPHQMTVEEMMFRHFKTDCRDLPQLKLSHNAQDDETVHARDFLTWLWYFSETTGGKLQSDKYGDFELMLEGPLTLAFFMEGQGATETTVKKGLPQKSAEAKVALAIGKKLRKSKLTIARGEDIWTGAFDADKCSFSSLRLPDGQEMEEHSRFAERVQNLYVFQDVFQEYFKAYVDFVTADDWEAKQLEIITWASERDSF